MRASELQHILKNAGLKEDSTEFNKFIPGRAHLKNNHSWEPDKIHDMALYRLNRSDGPFLQTSKGPFQVMTDDVDVVCYAEYLPEEGEVIARLLVSDEGLVHGIKMLPNKNTELQEAIRKQLGSLMRF